MTRWRDVVPRSLGEVPGLLVGVFFIVAGSVSSLGWSVSNWLARHGR